MTERIYLFLTTLSLLFVLSAGFAATVQAADVGTPASAKAEQAAVPVPLPDTECPEHRDQAGGTAAKGAQTAKESQAESGSTEVHAKEQSASEPESAQKGSASPAPVNSSKSGVAEKTAASAPTQDEQSIAKQTPSGTADTTEQFTQSPAPAGTVLDKRAAENPTPSGTVTKEQPNENPSISGSQIPKGTESDTNLINPNVRIISESEPAPPDTGPPAYHKAQMRLAGSMCYSCLNTLKRKLMQVYGVANIKIDKPVHNLFQPYAPDVSSWAEAVLIYDMNKVALADVRSFMRSNGYMSYKVVDKTFSDSLDTLKEQK